MGVSKVHPPMHLKEKSVLLCRHFTSQIRVCKCSPAHILRDQQDAQSSASTEGWELRMPSIFKIFGILPALPMPFTAEVSGSCQYWLLINSVHEEIKEIRHLQRLQTLQQSSSQRPLALKTAESKSPWNFIALHVKGEIMPGCALR